MLNETLRSRLSRHLRSVAPSLLLALSLLAGVPDSTGAASRHALLPSEVALELAEYAEGGAGEVWRVLGRLGLPDADKLARSEDLSPVMLLRWAYQAVEQSEQGAGKPFLSAFVSQVGASVPGIYQEPSIARLVIIHPPGRQQFTFQGRPAKVVFTAVDPAVRKVIVLIADITAAKGSQLSPRAILQRRLGLKENQVLEQIQRYGSGKEALADKLAKLPQPPQKEVLASIALDLLKANPAARREPVLGEAVFRWLGLKDRQYGEWFRYRDRMLDVTGAGEVNAPAHVKENAANAARQIRRDMALMIQRAADRGGEIDPAAIERMYFQYTKSEARAAALWGFAVIGMKQDFDFERYIPAEVARLLAKPGAVPGVYSRPGIEAYVREHGAYPHNGYQEYARLTGYDTVENAGKYFSTTPVQKAVAENCPGG